MNSPENDFGGFELHRVSEATQLHMLIGIGCFGRGFDLSIDPKTNRFAFVEIDILTGESSRLSVN